MLKKLSCALLIGFLLLPAVAAAQEAKTPTVVVRVRSFDTVVQNIKVIAKAVDQEALGDQLEQLIKAQTGPAGLDGVDTKRPIGLYVNVGTDLASASGVLMIPISDEKAFLKLLENVNYRATKNQNGVYIIQQFDVPFEIGFRFANNYAYVTGLNLDAIDKGNLIPPAKIFPAGATEMIAGTLRLDQIPKAIKDLAITQMEEELAKEKRKELPGETPAQRKLRQESLDFYAEIAADFLYGATEVTASFDVDAKSKMLKGRFFVDSKKNARLRVHIKDLEAPSLFAGLIKPNQAVSGLINYRVPKQLQKSFAAMIQDEIQKVLEKETSEKRREQAEAILKAFEPTLHAGDLDAGVAVQMHDNGQATVVAGVRVKDGQNIEQTARKLIQDLPPNDRERLKLDVAKVGAASIHRLDVQDKFEEKERRVLGDNPLFIAVRSDAILVAAGKDGLEALKKAAAAKAQPAPTIHLEMDLSKVGQFADKEEERAAAQKAFGKDERGIIRLSLRGGDTVNGRFEMNLSVLQYFVIIGQNTAEVGLQER